MKKIPTLFQRKVEDNMILKVLPKLTDESLAWALAGDGTATEMLDGACCAVIKGKLYTRRVFQWDVNDIAKRPPRVAIPCCDLDPVTGCIPCWMPVVPEAPSAQLYMSAYEISSAFFPDGTYEAVGLHFSGNPYCLRRDYLIKHDATAIDLPDRSLEGIRTYLTEHAIKGIVFWKDGEPQCKIKRSDFGLPWPDKKHQKHIDHYLYQIEVPVKYLEVLRNIAAKNQMTIEEMTVQGLIHITEHPDDMIKWDAELNALPAEERAYLSSIKVSSIERIYSDSLWLQQHTGGAV
ncbi:MAG: hypothetical protein IJ555_13000 [Ruminococcus sp.]|nr:hypothetical protein [Ruminococcus sp.]